MPLQIYGGDDDLEGESGVNPVAGGCMMLLLYKLGCRLAIGVLIGTVLLLMKLGVFPN